MKFSGLHHTTALIKSDPLLWYHFNVGSTVAQNKDTKNVDSAKKA